MAPPPRPFAALLAALTALAASGAPAPARAQGPAPPPDDGPLRRRPPPYEPPRPLQAPPSLAGDESPSRPARGDGRRGAFRGGDDAVGDDAPLRRRERWGPEAAPARAPRLALWLGGRVSAEAPVGDAFKDFGDRRFGEGQLVGAGAALELDVGARLGRRFVPFAFAQRLFASAGSASALPGARPPPLTPPDEGAPPPEAASPSVDGSSAFALGLGFRYEFAPERLGPVVEIAYAFRKTNVTFNTGQALSAEAPGELRVGVGASWRVADALTLSPLVTVAAGSYSDALFEGFDGRERAVRAEAPVHGYLGFSLGAHVDLFGKR